MVSFGETDESDPFLFVVAETHHVGFKFLRPLDEVFRVGYQLGGFLLLDGLGALLREPSR